MVHVCKKVQCAKREGMTENPPPQKVPLIFFRSGKGTEPVREWLKELPEAERHAVGKDLLKAQWRWPVGMPLCRPMGSGLWEIRTCLLYTSPSPRDRTRSRMPSSA